MAGGRIIVAHVSETEVHAADRILGALASSPGLERECVELAEISPAAGDGGIRSEDLLVLVCGADWVQRSAEQEASALLTAARSAGCSVHLVLLDDAPGPDSLELEESQQWLASEHWHTVRHEHWADDVADVVEALGPSVPVEAGPLRISPTRQMLLAAGLVGTVVILGAILMMSRMWTDTPAAVGRWVAQVDYGRSVVHTEQFEFRVAGGQITGTATWQGSRRIIEAAVQDGERLSFHTRSHDNRGSERRELRHDYVGIASDDTMRFSLRSSGGFEERDVIEFEARRVP